MWLANDSIVDQVGIARQEPDARFYCWPDPCQLSSGVKARAIPGSWLGHHHPKTFLLRKLGFTFLGWISHTQSLCCSLSSFTLSFCWMSSSSSFPRWFEHFFCLKTCLGFPQTWWSLWLGIEFQALPRKLLSRVTAPCYIPPECLSFSGPSTALSIGTLFHISCSHRNVRKFY